MILAGVILFCVAIGEANAGISFVQGTTSEMLFSGTQGTTTHIVADSAVTAGDFIVIGTFNASGSPVTSLVDNLGDTYTYATTTSGSSCGCSSTDEIWYTNAKSSGAWNATATFSAKTAQRVMGFVEYSGLASGTMDVYSGFNGSVDSMISGTSTITAAPELILGVSAAPFNNFSSTIPGNGFVMRTQSTSTGSFEILAFEDATTTVPSVAWSTPATQFSTWPYYDTMVTFKSATGGVPGTPGTPTYTNITTTTLKVNWTSASGSPTYYNIQRSTNANSSYSQIATTSALLYNDTGLSASTTYWYEVAGTNASGTGTYSATSSVTTLCTSFSDSFSRANSSTLGPNWTRALDALADFGISSNQAEVVSSGNFTADYWNNCSFSNDQYSEVTFSGNLPDVSDMVLVRATTTAGVAEAYEGGYNPGVWGGGNQYRIERELNGLPDHNLASSSQVAALNDTVELGVHGTTLSLIVNGITLLTATDSAITSGVPGISAENSSINTVVMDNASGGYYAGNSGACGGGTGNISTSTNNHWAWNDAVGWIDFCGSGNVTVSSTALSGYASSSVSDISLDCHTTSAGNICNGTNNYQVTNDGSGNLSNFGWNDTYGWISFDCNNNSGCGTSQYQVTIDSGGNFNNYAWNDTIGWISFNCANSGGSGCGASNYEVQTSWFATATNGSLDSTTYDTGVANGAQLNSFIWQGSLPAGTNADFQFAVSNSSSGPWNYMGSDGTANTFYSVAPATSQPLDYSLFNGYRYFRYRVTLTADTTNTLTPQVNNVIVNWSP